MKHGEPLTKRRIVAGESAGAGATRSATSSLRPLGKLATVVGVTVGQSGHRHRAGPRGHENHPNDGSNDPDQPVPVDR